MTGTGPDLGFYKGVCQIHLKGAPEVQRRSGVESGEEAVLPPQKILYFLDQNCEFYCIPKRRINFLKEKFPCTVHACKNDQL